MFVKKTGILLFILVSIITSSCEKDDICVDGETPLLVLEFFEFDAAEETTKTVSKLRIVGEGKNVTVSTIADRSDLQSITLPLRVDETVTTYHFIVNSADDANGVETGNTDMIAFNYTNKEVYVSRACGFVMHFDALSTTLETDAENWIKNIEIAETLVENQAVTHVKIYH
ncbi:DUF6452 family protein [Cellulophaga sp. F20128]|uniref:DUF6452 family protein n=1 Tax=Cellulophaga sp. F20128 TaxID=2926413 RepID=UPI001FF1343A|nr:DUF6452 family protein [Cellulophaga sp. F20128]MCK0157576.1 DUF6452 family protein [Cellulophaga sp. F20128]